MRPDEIDERDRAIAVFDAAEAESLAVVEPGHEHRPIGVLNEAHAMRRYAEESERRRREVVVGGDTAVEVICEGMVVVVGGTVVAIVGGDVDVGNGSPQRGDRQQLRNEVS